MRQIEYISGEGSPIIIDRPLSRDTLQRTGQDLWFSHRLIRQNASSVLLKQSSITCSSGRNSRLEPHLERLERSQCCSMLASYHLSNQPMYLVISQALLVAASQGSAHRLKTRTVVYCIGTMGWQYRVLNHSVGY